MGSGDREKWDIDGHFFPDVRLPKCPINVPGGGGVAINFFFFSLRGFCLGDICELLQLLVSFALGTAALLLEKTRRSRGLGQI